MPPGSGVPVPGANAGSSTSTSTRQEDRPLAGDADRARDDVLDPVLAHLVHEEARYPALGLPAELGLARPVAAQPDLDVALGVDVPRLDEPVHRRPVRDLDAEDLGPGVGVSVEMDEAERAMRFAQARMSGSAIPWSPPSTIGTAPASSTSPTVASIASWVRAGSAGSTGASP